MATAAQCRIGVIADTHGLLRPEARQALAGRCDWIIHAGDFGKADVLDQLRALAPVIGVRGNVDRGAWADALPMTHTQAFGTAAVHVLHDLHELDLDPKTAGVRVVISGHSHQPVIEEREGVLFLNPGSAGPRRFRLPITLAMLEIDRDGAPSARLVDLDRGGR